MWMDFSCITSVRIVAYYEATETIALVKNQIALFFNFYSETWIKYKSIKMIYSEQIFLLARNCVKYTSTGCALFTMFFDDRLNENPK